MMKSGYHAWKQAFWLCIPLYWVANKVEKVGQSKVGQAAGAIKQAVVQRVPKVLFSRDASLFFFSRIVT